MSMFQSTQVDLIEATVIVSQTSDGDYNGTTGDVIQAAIDSLGVKGGWIFIKPGVYDISVPITITTEFVTLEGVYGSTIFNQIGDISVLKVTGDYFIGKNIITNGSGLGGGINYCWDVDSFYAVIDTCEIYDAVGGGFNLVMNYGIISYATAENLPGIGYNIHDTSDAIIYANIADSCGSEGYNIIDSFGIQVLSCVASLCGSHGFSYTNTLVCNFVSCLSDTNTGNGLFMDTCSYLVVEGSFSQNNSSEEIYLTNCTNGLFTNLEVPASTQKVIYFDNCNYFTIQGMILISDDDCVTLNDCYNVNCSNNILESTSGRGILAQTGIINSHHITINSNIVSGKTSSIEITDSSYVIINNNTATATNGNGVYIHCTSLYDYYTINNNYIDSAFGTAGVYIIMAEYVSINNNVIFSSQDGIRFYDNSNYVTISGNIIFANANYTLINIIANGLNAPWWLTIANNICGSQTRRGLYINQCQFVTISNNWIDAVGEGVYLDGDSGYDTIINNNIIDSDGYNIRVNQTWDVKIDSNIMYALPVMSSTTGYGVYGYRCLIYSINSNYIDADASVGGPTYSIYMDRSTLFSVSNNTFYFNSGNYLDCGSGVLFNGNSLGTGTNCNYSLFTSSNMTLFNMSNNIFTNAYGGSNTVQLEQPLNSNISNNVFYTTSKECIKMSGGSHCNINNNVFRHSGSYGGSYTIDLNGGAYNILSGNNLQRTNGTVTYGIYEGATSDYNLIGNNIVRGFTTNYTISGSNTVVGVNGDWV